MEQEDKFIEAWLSLPPAPRLKWIIRIRGEWFLRRYAGEIVLAAYLLGSAIIPDEGVLYYALGGIAAAAHIANVTQRLYNRAATQKQGRPPGESN